jgi:hypothetical protein
MADLKPADLYISSKSFFAVLVPGVVITTAVTSLQEDEVLSRVENASTAAILAWVLVSYIVGYVLNALIKRLVHRLPRVGRLSKLLRAVPRPTPEEAHGLTAESLQLEAMRLAARIDPISSRYVGPGQWCRRLVQQHAPNLAASFIEVETEVEFLASMAPAMATVAVAAVRNSTFWPGVVWACLSGVTAALFWWRFLEMRAYEQRAWFTKALMLDGLGLFSPSNQSQTNRISPAAVVSIFKENTTVWFNWQRYLEEGWPTTFTVYSREQLDQAEVAGTRLYAPWYVDGAGAPVDYTMLERHREARALTIREAGSREHVDMARRERINRLRVQFEAAERVEYVSALGYSVGDAGIVILDGNHRLAALFATARDFRLGLFIINGPLQVEAAADTLLWVRKRAARAG